MWYRRGFAIDPVLTKDGTAAEALAGSETGVQASANPKHAPISSATARAVWPWRDLELMGSTVAGDRSSQINATRGSLLNADADHERLTAEHARACPSQDSAPIDRAGKMSEGCDRRTIQVSPGSQR